MVSLQESAAFQAATRATGLRRPRTVISAASTPKQLASRDRYLLCRPLFPCFGWINSLFCRLNSLLSPIGNRPQISSAMLAECARRSLPRLQLPHRQVIGCMYTKVVSLGVALLQYIVRLAIEKATRCDQIDRGRRLLEQFHAHGFDCAFYRVACTCSVRRLASGASAKSKMTGARVHSLKARGGIRCRPSSRSQSRSGSQPLSRSRPTI